MNAVVSGAHALAVISNPRVDLFGVVEAPENQQDILLHALEAVRSYQEMKRNALQMCLSLYLCREGFASSGDEGWQKFCAANFAPLGLSDSNVRHCVRAGRELAKITKRLHDEGRSADVSTLEQLSRSALIQISDAPESVRNALVDKIVAAEAQNPGSVTAAGVNERIQELELELHEKNSLLDSKDASLQRMSQSLTVAEEALASRRKELDQKNAELAQANAQLARAQAQSNTKTEVITPTGEEMALKKAREQLESQVQGLKHEVTSLDSQRAQIQAELDKVEREAKQKKTALQNIQALEADVNRLMTLWTADYVSKLRGIGGDQYVDRYKAAAATLRLIAQQIDSDLFDGSSSQSSGG